MPGVESQRSCVPLRLGSSQLGHELVQGALQIPYFEARAGGSLESLSSLVYQMLVITLVGDLREWRGTGYWAPKSDAYM